MIHIRFNSSSRFGLGFEWTGRDLNYYSVRRLDVHLLIITISIVVTRFNT